MVELADGSRRPPFPETPGRVDIALAIPLHHDRLLVARRSSTSHLAGHWEFPGGKIESGEAPADAARRELEEETGLVALTLEHLVVTVHDYADAALRFHAFLARDPTGDVSMDGSREFAWVRYSELAQLEMPEANARIVRALRWRI